MRVPPHATAHLLLLGGLGNTEHTLVRDGHVLHVYAPNGPGVEQDRSTIEILTYVIGLLETLLHTIDFTQTATAFLVRRKDGHILIPKKLRPKTFKITYPTWERLIDEREIEITDWISAENRKGRWNNMDIEIWYGYEDRYLTFVQRAMISLDALRRRNLDLHFKVLGHLICDNEVVGIVMEVNGGRYVELCDRALAYNAFQELQKHNLLLYFPEFSIANLKVADGKIRFPTRNLQNLKDVSRERDPVRLALARQSHWDALDSVMRTFDKAVCFRGLNPHGKKEIDQQNLGARLLAYIPFPERPLLLDIHFSTDYNSNIIWNRHRRANTRKTRFPTLSKCDEHWDTEHGRDEGVSSVSVSAVALSRTSRRRQERQYEPYHRLNIPYSPVWSDVGDSAGTEASEGDLHAHFTTL
ncbi:uncharacterized protein BT62DRAFT_922067 [Guyanagaster necrorhizus]|uniref:Uncharacterized protein n=1 Tax=Guyanagaster necrorhizus TaxID=856835 RepID=A0A9P7VMJ6_9AGAR|nr:uncharacterized protein BT62DRAFT_922067 [Guyanagaster necrorhizus MCA 3950]KAG7443288.1 hypothetical protein BT62DRAFT_922067 [Guyanagaster necrorhizus MCA 3950]